MRDDLDAPETGGMDAAQPSPAETAAAPATTPLPYPAQETANDPLPQIPPVTTGAPPPAARPPSCH